MNWHCVADPLATKYCIGIPDWEKEPVSPSVGRESYMGICKLSPETCGRCKTSQQLWDELPQEEKDRVSKPNYIQNIISIEKPKAGEEKKPISKKAKQLEAEIAQRSMF